MKCRHCGVNDCLFHCQENGVTGQHVADLQDVAARRSANDDKAIVVETKCRLCGAAGYSEFFPHQFHWTEP